MALIKNILTQGSYIKDRYISDYSELRNVVNTLKESGFKIVMTQGVYDLFHIGHGRYLEEARSFGDILVVALDTDEYTHLRKGNINERRPIVSFEERKETLTFLRSVDIITRRDIAEHKDDPYAVIRVVEPDVLVLSRSTKDINEADYKALESICGKVEVLEAKAVISTTSRIRELLLDGAVNFATHILDAVHKVVDEYFSEGGRDFKITGKNEK
jgi:D-beta-D-heptose 7-phosphate kinase/D-beta-D-heptose 1-phosphate adenosyltransferase